MEFRPCRAASLTSSRSCLAPRRANVLGGAVTFFFPTALMCCFSLMSGITSPPGYKESPAQFRTARAQKKRALFSKCFSLRRFSQVWVECGVVEVRLFLTSAYLFAIAWRHPSVAADRYRKRARGKSFAVRWLFSFAVVRRMREYFIGQHRTNAKIHIVGKPFSKKQ